MNFDDVEALLAVFAESGWDELHVQTGDFELFLSNDPSARANAGTATATTARAPAPGQAEPFALEFAPPARKPARHEPAPAQEPAEGTIVVRAPSLGTFYRAPKPGAASYVELGSHVGPEDTICLIEVMKLYTVVKAECSGTISRICVADGTMVEYDTPLFYIEPSE